MTSPNHQLADVLREVTPSMQTAIADGYRSRMIDEVDLVEVPLAIVDRLDPPVPNVVAAPCACPDCGEQEADRLVVTEEGLVRCGSCGSTFDPAAGSFVQPRTLTPHVQVRGRLSRGGHAECQAVRRQFLE
jgi:ribosomal protein L37AE/L43A